MRTRRSELDPEGIHPTPEEEQAYEKVEMAEPDPPEDRGPEPPPEGPEEINHPAHYGGDTTYEAIKVIEAWNLGFHDGCAAKYLCRQGKKSPDRLRDLKKARWYLDRLIKLLEESA